MGCPNALLCTGWRCRDARLDRCTHRISSTGYVLTVNSRSEQCPVALCSITRWVGTRIFRPAIVAGLHVTIGHYVNKSTRLEPVWEARFTIRTSRLYSTTRCSPIVVQTELDQERRKPGQGLHARLRRRWTSCLSSTWLHRGRPSYSQPQQYHGVLQSLSEVRQGAAVIERRLRHRQTSRI